MFFPLTIFVIVFGIIAPYRLFASRPEDRDPAGRRR
jgi:hypothetical protein